MNSHHGRGKVPTNNPNILKLSNVMESSISFPTSDEANNSNNTSINFHYKDNILIFLSQHSIDMWKVTITT